MHFTDVKQIKVSVTTEQEVTVPAGVGLVVVQGRNGTVTVAWRAGDITASAFFTAPAASVGKPYKRLLTVTRERTIYIGPGTGDVAEVEFWS